MGRAKVACSVVAELMACCAISPELLTSQSNFNHKNMRNTII